MRIATRIGTVLMLLLGTAAVPAHARSCNGNAPPGDPCGSGPGQGRGNPCNGNNGNPGTQGNANRERVVHEDPRPLDISLPAVQGRGAFVTQIGESGSASISQSATNAFAAIRQDGPDHRATATQAGSGTAYANVDQRGDGHDASVRQEGTGQNFLHMTQEGGLNRAAVTQNAAGAIFNGAVVTQRGIGNEVTLVQDGEDNRAILTQEGDANAMSATQSGAGNRLEWTQTGTNLSDLGITQSGAQAIRITQSGVGR